MITFTINPFMDKAERFAVLARIRKELSNVRSTPVCVINMHKLRLPLFITKNKRVSIA